MAGRVSAEAMMDSTRQVIRWSMPGGIFLLCLVASSFVLHHAAKVRSPDWSDINIALVGAGVALSIPAGFLIYQLYFTLYHSHLLPTRKRTVPIDRGASILRHQDARFLNTLEGALKISLDIREVTSETRAARWSPFGTKRYVLDDEMEWEEYRERARANMATVKACLDVSACHHGFRELKDEYTRLTDIYHALGASRVALITGSLLALVYSVVFLWPLAFSSTLSGAGFAILTFATLALGLVTFLSLKVLAFAREDTLRTSIDVTRYGILWVSRIDGSPLDPDVLGRPSELGREES